MQDQLDGVVASGPIRQWPDEVALQRLLDRRPRRRQGIGCRHGIRRVGVDQDLRALAADQAPREVRRYLDDELHIAPLQELVASLSVAGRCVKSKYPVLASPASTVRVMRLWSAMTSAVGRRRGSVLI